MLVFDCPSCCIEMLPQVSVGRFRDEPQMHGIWFCELCGFQECSQNSPINITEPQYLAALDAVLPLTQMHGELTQEQRNDVVRRAVQLNQACREALLRLFA